MSGEGLDGQNWGCGAGGVHWVEARDTALHPSVHSAVSRQRPARPQTSAELGLKPSEGSASTGHRNDCTQDTPLARKQG